jgi:phage-related protein (TIGR01555 family)
MSKRNRINQRIGRYNLDGFVNSMSGMGVAGLDKKTATNFIPNLRLDQRTLQSMYRYDWLTRKICDKPAYDAIKKFINIQDESGEELLDLMKPFAIKDKLKTAVAWARLFGGAAIIPIVDDGLDPSEPFDIERVNGLVDILVFDRYRMQPTGQELDLNSPQYLKPEFYQVQQTKWHHSRVLIVHGDTLTFDDMQQEQGWGGSVMDACIDPIKQLSESYNDIRHLMGESSIGVTKIPGLSLMGTGGELFNAIANRLNTLNANKSIYRSMALDKEEDFEWMNRTFTGLENVLDRFMTQMAACTSMPELILFGKSRGGLSSGQQEEMEVYFDLVEAIQHARLDMPVGRIVDIFAKIAGIDSPAWQWNPLQQMNQVEQADIRLKNAQALALETDSLGLTEDEARDITKRSDQMGLFEELGESDIEIDEDME